MKQIPLTRGKYAIIDDEDFTFLNQWKWYCSSSGYANRSIRLGAGGKKKIIHMHRLISNCPSGQQVDHRDLNRLNNQKSNLRICNQSQNEMNKNIRRDNTTGYRGISLNGNKYIRARINVGGRQIHLGYFPDLISAAQARDTATKKYFGEFTRVNP
jgi:hypothetical protein